MAEIDFFYVPTTLGYSNFISSDSVLPADHSDSMNDEFPDCTSEYFTVFSDGFQHFQQTSDAICTKLSTLDQVHCSHCPLWWTSDDAKPVCLWLVFMAGFTNPCLIVCSSKLRFSKSSICYYANTTSCFNIILAGDIELNPGPESSGSTAACNKKPSSNTYFQVYLQNVRSLKNKLDMLHSSMVAHLQPLGMFNFFALTATWLTDDVLYSELSIPNYTIFRKDRMNRHGGGVLLGCHNTFEYRRRPDFEQDNLELLEVRLSSRNKVLLGNFYRVPDSGAQPLEALADTLTNVSHQYNHICIVGDFNLPSLQWNSGSGLSHHQVILALMMCLLMLS